MRALRARFIKRRLQLISVLGRRVSRPMEHSER